MTQNYKDPGAWIHTHTGKKFYPLEPDGSVIDSKDIIHALSNICRFTGHVDSFYSVAEHEVRVARHVRDCMKLTESGVTSSKRNMLISWALTHDDTEAYLTDVSAPLKRTSVFEAYREREKYLERMIARHWGLPEEMPDEVREADIIMCVTEAQRLFVGAPPTPEWLEKLPPACPECLNYNGRLVRNDGRSGTVGWSLSPVDAAHVLEVWRWEYGLVSVNPRPGKGNEQP